MFKSSIHFDENGICDSGVKPFVHPTATFIHFETNYRMLFINSVKVSMLNFFLNCLDTFRLKIQLFGKKRIKMKCFMMYFDISGKC